MPNAVTFKENLSVVIPDIAVLLPSLDEMCHVFQFMLQEVTDLNDCALYFYSDKAKSVRYNRFASPEIEQWNKHDVANLSAEELFHAIKCAANQQDASDLVFRGTMDTEGLRLLCLGCSVKPTETGNFYMLIHTELLRDKSQWHRMANPELSREREENIGVALIERLKEVHATFVAVDEDPYKSMK